MLTVQRKSDRLYPAKDRASVAPTGKDVSELSPEEKVYAEKNELIGMTRMPSRARLMDHEAAAKMGKDYEIKRISTDEIGNVWSTPV